MGVFSILKGGAEEPEKNDSWQAPTEEAKKEPTFEEKMKTLRNGNLFGGSGREETVREPEASQVESEIFQNQSPNVRICTPKAYENVEAIGQAIKSRKIVILDMSKLEQNVATRILDFVYGICYVLDIVPENINPRIIMIDPDHRKRR